MGWGLRAERDTGAGNTQAEAAGLLCHRTCCRETVPVRDDCTELDTEGLIVASVLAHYFLPCVPLHQVELSIPILCLLEILLALLGLDGLQKLSCDQLPVHPSWPWVL